MCLIKNTSSTPIQISYRMRNYFYHKYFSICKQTPFLDEVREAVEQDIDQQMIDILCQDTELSDSNELMKRVRYFEQMYLLQELKTYYELMHCCNQFPLLQCVMSLNTEENKDKIKVLK